MKSFLRITHLLFSVLILASCGQYQEAPAKAKGDNIKKIEYEINRNVVTFRIAYNLVDRELRFPVRPNPVRNALDSFFLPYKNSKIVTSMTRSDIGYDDVLTQYLLHQKEFPEFGAKYDYSRTIEEMALDGYPGIDTLYSRLYKELYDFYIKANVEKFISEMDFYYNGSIQEIKKIASKYDVVQQMEDYCRMENHRYIVSPEPLFQTGGSRGIGPSVPTAQGKICYQFISPSSSIDLGAVEYSGPSPQYGYADEDYIRTIMVHEFGHSFVNLDLAKEANRKFIENKSSLFTDDIQKSLENTGIGEFHTYIVEHIVRLLEIRIADKFIGEAEAKKLREENKAFIWLPQMEELIIAEYESDADNSKSFADFIPELLTVIK